MSKIIVIGSANTDMVVKTSRFPEPGETIIGGDFFMFPGGKGANQAVAAARAGGNVVFICALGDDIFGKNALAGYQKEGIDIADALIVKNGASGVALITVNQGGENEIVVASGTNSLLSPAYVEARIQKIKVDDIVLTQLETPMETLEFLSAEARRRNLRLILNPAPARPILDRVLKGLFLITPNETEARILTALEVNDPVSRIKAAEILLKKGVRNVIITLGSEGSFFMNDRESFHVPSPKVKAVDTTAAGDIFNGVLAVCLSKGTPWMESMQFASRAAALSVTKMGAQGTAPTREEINTFK